MKNLKHIVFAFITTFFLTNCSDDFLERLPEDTLSPETFFDDSSNLEAALFGVYDALQNAQSFGYSTELDGISDNTRIDRFGADLIDFSLGNATADVRDDRGSISNYYAEPYTLIQRANLLLANIDVQGAISEGSRQQIDAEARVLRAIAYFKLVYLFGDVPLITEPLSRSDLLEVTRASREEVIDFIRNELENSSNVLGTSLNPGRINRQTALGFLSKLLVYEARLGNVAWSEALVSLNNTVQACESAGHDLFIFGDGSDGNANYTQLFYEANEDNQEIIFAVKNNELDGGRGGFTTLSIAVNTHNVTVHTNLVDNYYTIDGLPITDPGSIYDPTNPFENRDPRLKSSILTPGDVYPDDTGEFLPYEGIPTNPTLLTDFAYKKIVTRDGLNLVNVNALDGIMLRYADILLMLAEAENEVNGPSGTAYNAVNRVRQRAGMPGFQLGLSAAEFRLEVLHERRIELVFEGQRWFDLVTLRIADQIINNINELERAFVTNQQELLPIPQSEIDLNSNLSQNPGY